MANAVAVEIAVFVTQSYYNMTLHADGQLYALAYPKREWEYQAALDHFRAQHRERIGERVPAIRMHAEDGVDRPRA